MVKIGKRKRVENMKQLWSPVIVLLRQYCSVAGSSRPNLRVNKYKSRQKSETKNSPKRRAPSIQWTEEQSQVLGAIGEGKSVFISGSAGTGKTFLVEHIIKQLKKIHGKSGVFVTASTGVAACALNGMTLHSFAGTGWGKDDRVQLLSSVVSNRRAYNRWNKVKALVIDEISMIGAAFFEKLEYIARAVRGKDQVWGGMQLVVSGDFFQLPPVPEKEDGKQKEYAFEADCWDASFELQMELTKVFRQADPQLVKLLQGIRKGENDPDDLNLFEQCYAQPEDDPLAVQLFPRIDDVSRVNRRKLLSLNEEIIVYNALDVGDDQWKKQLTSGIAPERAELCVGARVMLCKNIRPRSKLVNGATGTVVGFVDESRDSIPENPTYEKAQTDIARMCSHGCLLPVVKFDFGEKFIVDIEEWYVMDGEMKVAVRKQIPLVLAWALSIHKCQGMTLDRLHTDLQRAFGCGMVYVALSRVKTLDGLHLSGFCPGKIKADPKVLQFYKNFSRNKDRQKGSVVLSS